MRKSLVFSLAVCLLPSALSSAPKYASPQGYVTDTAGILDASSRQTLESQLSEFERATGTEIAVVTVPSLENDTVESYANGLFSQWRIGKKDKNNGLLILIAPNERKARIEVGYGLEPVLTDGICGDIIRSQMLPYFKQGQYGQGVVAGVGAIQAVLTKEVSPAPAPSVRLTSFPAWKQLISVLIFLFFVLPCTAIGALLAAMAFFFAPAPWRFFGLMGLPFGLILDLTRFRASGPSSYRGGGFFGGGGFSGGGFGGFGGGGGGGFGGFGGGMSGGGGASGGW